MATPLEKPPASEVAGAASRTVAASSRLLDRARERTRQLADDFRRADRFFKMRLGIVGAWAVVSMATLWGACSTFGPTSSLGADVQVNGNSIMGVQLLVRNESNRIWEDVVLTLDDGWKYTHKTMRPHDLVVLSMSSFKKGDDAPPRDYKPRALVIACGQGKERFDLR